jgi:CheY-like chemotaxis protein
MRRTVSYTTAARGWFMVPRCNSVSPVKRRGSETTPRSQEPGEDLAGALHEVSNTLTVVLGWLDAAKRDIPAGVAHEAIDVALSHARLGHAIARRAIGAEVPDANVTRSALSVARDAVVGVAQEAARRGVRVRTADEGSDDLLVVAAPVAQQILMNLLLNAVHFSPPGASVTLSVESAPQSMFFRVTDAGPGIPPSRAASLFHSPESTRPGGAGIGLRHAHALAARHGGTLVLSRTGSSGSEFELAWPIGDAPSRAHRSVPPQSLDGLRVLLLEDDPAVQALIDLGLSARGATVGAASTLEELTKMVQHGVFDVALLDLSPLGDDPSAALSLIEGAQRGLPIVIISGSVAPHVDAPSIAAWVRKPFEVGELVQALTRVAPR